MRIHKLFPRIDKISFRLKDNKFPHCGRDMCYCMYQLNLNKKEDRRYYKECYKMWFNMFGKKLKSF